MTATTSCFTILLLKFVIAVAREPVRERAHEPSRNNHSVSTHGGAGVDPIAHPSHAPTRPFDVEAYAQRALERGLGEDELTWQDFDILFRPVSTGSTSHAVGLSAWLRLCCGLVLPPCDSYSPRCVCISSRSSLSVDLCLQILVHSFVLIKHGRSGLPKRHRFWMTNALNRLYWDTTKFVDLMRTGERHIEMSDVVCLIDGVGTELLRRKLARGEIALSHQDRCFSLVTTTRTFDLEALSVAQRKVLVRAFNFLVKHLSRQSTFSTVSSATTGGRARGGSGGGIGTSGYHM